jgi:hypothetical protein
VKFNYFILSFNVSIINQFINRHFRYIPNYMFDIRSQFMLNNFIDFCRYSLVSIIIVSFLKMSIVVIKYSVCLDNVNFKTPVTKKNKIKSHQENSKIYYPKTKHRVPKRFFFIKSIFH